MFLTAIDRMGGEPPVTARDRIRSSWQKLPVAMLSLIGCNWQKAGFAKS